MLINGIDRQRDLYLDELRYLARCLDHLSKSSVAEIDAVIDKVFESPKESGLSEDTLDLLNNLERIEKVEGSEEQAWGYLTSRFIHGAYHPTLETICHRLMNDGFEIFFSLLPLLTGKELKFDEEGRVEETQISSIETQLPLIENLKQELSDLLKNVFTRHIDISGATHRRQSEARLAQMIVHHCLNVRDFEDSFRERIKLHLKEHYDVHLHFLKEHIGESELFKYIHKIGSDVEAMIQQDTDEVVRLTNVSRNRLFSRTNNNRLLCFIDPTSVEVQIGEFDYGGKTIESEMAYISDKEDKRRNLVNKWNAPDAENSKIGMGKSDKKEIKRSIEFPPEYHQAGISILNYFSRILKEKYKETKASIQIVQDGLKVIMVIDPKEGDPEVIERALDEYGLVVRGNVTPEDFFSSDPLEAMALRNKIQLVGMELRQTRELLQFAEKTYGEKIRIHENEIQWLRESISVMLLHSNPENQDKGSFSININNRNVQTDKKRAKNMSKDNININAGGDVAFATDEAFAQINKTITESANLPETLETKLKDLSDAVQKMTQEMPDAQAKDVTQDLQTLAEEATKEAPRKKWYELSGQGIIDAATAVGVAGKPVIDLTREVMKLLGG